VSGIHAEPFDLTAGTGPGPIWGLASDDLNVTLLAWPAHEGVADQVNEERGVLLVVIEGSGSVRVDGVEHPLEAGHGSVVEKGRRFGIVASETGLRYLSIHVRRPPLQVAPLA
jgi:mannose-6-phosphate isomerase-like protein (cupin superfamily)